MNVLLIPEDPRRDKYFLKPLFEALFRSIGKPRARVRVCENPVLGGDGAALKSRRLSEVVKQHDGMTRIFILCVDRDGHLERRHRLRAIEKEFGEGRIFLAENAWEELEAWVLAGLELPDVWRWADVRAEVHVKERYFDEVVKARGLGEAPGGGRKPLGEEAARRIHAVRQKCPDDFDALAKRLQAIVHN